MTNDSPLTPVPDLDDSETVEGQLTVEDILSEANKASYHTILELWREIFAPAKTERLKKITPQWANRIVTSFAGVTFADMPAFRDYYFDMLQELDAILLVEIDTDDECLKHTSAEEDVEHNTHHYLNVLITWQKQFMQWELEWDTTNPTAAVELAALSEVHKMFFDANGVTNLLDQIKFVFTDADRELLAAELADLVEQAQGGGSE